MPLKVIVALVAPCGIKIDRLKFSGSWATDLVTVAEVGEAESEDRVAVQVSDIAPWPTLFVRLLSTIKETSKVSPGEASTV